MDDYLKKNLGCKNKEIILAFDKLYNAGIDHRDITGKNIIVNEDGDIKIIDYGSSKISSEPIEKRKRNYSFYKSQFSLKNYDQINSDLYFINFYKKIQTDFKKLSGSLRIYFININ